MKKFVFDPMRRRGLVVLAFLLLSGCGDDLTEIVVVVDSQRTLREALTEVRITVFGSSAVPLLDERVDLASRPDPKFPLTVSLSPAEGFLGNIGIQLEAIGNGSVVMRRRANVQFVSGESRMLRLIFHPECRTRECDDTCGNNGECRPVDISEEELETWPGEAPDLPVCNPVEEVSCNEVDDDCDDKVDESNDFANDPLHCGSCSNSCEGDFCVQGVCAREPWTVHTLGERHACSIFVGEDGVFCLGANDRGQLGDGTTEGESRLYTLVVGLQSSLPAAGKDHTCALREDGTIACWGAGNRGQLGDGELLDRSEPVTVMGRDDFTSVGAGFEHSCGIDAEGDVYCWGANNKGQVDGVPGSKGDNRPTATNANVANTALQVAGGELHTCALVQTSGGTKTVECWGENAEGQLGSSNQTSTRETVDRISGATAIAVGRAHTCVLLNTQRILCFGANDEGQSGMNPDLAFLSGATMVGTGRNHTCAVHRGRSSAIVASCFGNNDRGQLLSETPGGATPIPVNLAGTPTHVWAGFDRTCVWTTENGPTCSTPSE